MTQKIQAVFEGLEDFGYSSDIQVEKNYEMTLSDSSLLCGISQRYESIQDEEGEQGTTDYFDHCSFEIFEIDEASQLITEHHGDLNNLMTKASSFTEAQWLELFDLLVPLIKKGLVGHAVKSGGFQKIYQTDTFESYDIESGYSLELDKGVYALEKSGVIETYFLGEQDFDQVELTAEDLLTITAELELKVIQEIFSKTLAVWQWDVIATTVLDSKNKDS